jgi:uncharacterized membrane protein
MTKQKPDQKCAISGKPLPRSQLMPLELLRPPIAERIRRDHPDLPPDALISRHEADRYRVLYVQDLLREENGELSDLDQQVTRSLAEGEVISQNIEREFETRRSLGERTSDALAEFGGSWRFLIAFAVILAIWILFNSKSGAPFDPFPFILLNLILSCIAAIQAPIIMMSQRRQEEKDRLRSFNDYRVNLKAELEIRHLHEKIDHLLFKQWQRLSEIQELQIEIMQNQAR